MPHARPLVPLLAILLLGGCSQVQKPSLALNGMNVKGADADGFTMDFDAAVSNPNAAAIPLGDVKYDLAVGGKKLLGGSAAGGGTIPAGGSRDFTFPVAVKWADLLEAKDAISKAGGEVPYALSGDLAVPGGLPLVGGQSVPFKYDGTLSVASLLKNGAAAMKSPAARELAQSLMGKYLPF